MELEQRGQEYVARFLAASPERREAMRPWGRELAGLLRSESIGLQMSRATEFSPRIVPLTLLAAKVGLLAHGPDAPELEELERDIRYYARFPKSQSAAEEYERFRESVLR